MADLDYLGWEWRQFYDVVFVHPSSEAIGLCGIYPIAILLGLIVLHRTQLLLSDRRGSKSRSAYLRRQLGWEEPAVISVFAAWLLAAVLFPVQEHH